ncbi:interleukin-1 receptor type 1-like isoform X2 [Pristis pectinata]|uniref:interleukin-1 receptor type 1-like isoform X2 n=1 Tax=Pristis pectinata TaxID=685728 RepID=UPI00223E8B0E|nr:interleukin-1 receptor type 1-like isoform X2 [Pristis pectinata]
MSVTKIPRAEPAACGGRVGGQPGDRRRPGSTRLQPGRGEAQRLQPERGEVQRLTCSEEHYEISVHLSGGTGGVEGPGSGLFPSSRDSSSDYTWKMTASILVLIFGFLPFMLALPLQFSPTVESCQDWGVNFDRHFALEREAAVLKCTPLEFIFKELMNATTNYSVVWYHNKTSEVITTDKMQRIHVEADSLWFLPVLSEDTDHYICVVRYSTFCIKEAISLTVTNRTSALCPQNGNSYGSSSYSGIAKVIYCPDIMEYFGSNEDITLNWYKNCEPISHDGEKYHYHEGDWHLTVKDVDPSDEGKYVCELLFMHNGLRYVTSRTIDFNIKGCKASVGPQIMHPKNGTIEILPGSNLNLSCVAYTGYCDPSMTIIYWLVNNEFIEDYINESFQVEQRNNEGQGNYYQMNIILTNFKEEYYNKVFKCIAQNGLGYQIAAINFRKAAADFTREIVAIFGVFACVLFICVCTYKIFKIDIVLCFRDTFAADSPQNDGKRYDAYIIYPQSTSSCNPDILLFVMNILPHVLEFQCGYKLFIPGRDDLPGEAFVEQVKTNIKESRRLIILMARSFDEQLFEQQVGLHDALLCDQMKVILIEMEYHNDYSGFSESMRHIIQKKGTIKWKSNEWTTNSPSSNSKFWKQVRYNMPPRSSWSRGSIEHIRSARNVPQSMVL